MIDRFPAKWIVVRRGPDGLQWGETSNQAAPYGMAALEHEAVDAYRWREYLN